MRLLAALALGIIIGSLLPRRVTRDDDAGFWEAGFDRW